MIMKHTGGAYIWSRPVNNNHKIILYWASEKATDDAIKWNGIYPDGYFNKKLYF